MSIYKFFLISVLLSAVFFLASCGTKEDVSGAKPRVFVGIPPMKTMVEAVAGDAVEVVALLQPGQSPHHYEVTPQQMTQLASGKLFIRIGLNFEELLAKRLAKMGASLQQVDASDGINKITFGETMGHDAEHCAHDHVGEAAIDPHVWMSPREALVISENIFATLAVVFPRHAETFRQRYKLWAEELVLLDEEIRETLAPVQGETLLVYHPAFGYFCHAYGLRQMAVETGGREPSPSHLRELMAIAKEKKSKVVFVQKQFPGASAEVLADAMGGRVVPLDPLAPNYIENLREVARQVRLAFAE